ncbi:unnamed protein product [Protopolystoma xenopodis]|uniref:Uncharacterized protein n=1 Tax=Protopolystoma xenopodis TaxID=117903 RepID=A0A3S5ANK9_9PLAT|nr:unnamed protein product [Protopolystoma xenopodis]
MSVRQVGCDLQPITCLRGKVQGFFWRNPRSMRSSFGGEFSSNLRLQTALARRRGCRRQSGESSTHLARH